MTSRTFDDVENFPADAVTEGWVTEYLPNIDMNVGRE